MDIQKETLHGFRLIFDEEAREGLRFLRDDLQFGEVKTLFDAARLTGSAEFEDHSERNWTLVYNRQDGNYTLMRRTRD